MNRLVIVGNGFDLAHGLPTGYCDFIDWYWRNVFSYSMLNLYTLNYKDELITFKAFFSHDTYNDKAFRAFLVINTYVEFENFKSALNEIPHHGFNYSLNIHNDFFALINEYRQKNWVDIENEYYRLLKDCLNEDNSEKVKKLNEEFEEVKKLLEKYLTEHIAEKYDFEEPNENAKDFLNIFQILPKYLPSQEGVMLLKEFPKSDRDELIEYNSKVLLANPGLTEEIRDKKIIPKTNLFLNFNYTPTVDNYIKLIERKEGLNGYCKHIQIHGRLNDPYNQINFGFGDEMDDHYKQIENKDDNEYLRNIKSFQYLQNSNYKDLLDFIDSEKFQVYIMGHSCGLSDRILLNTIFEHEHCRSIKVFYHEKDGKDNYTDIVQNISRHFNKKKMMRDKLVNKSLCQPLPQKIRFAEK